MIRLDGSGANADSARPEDWCLWGVSMGERYMAVVFV
jgi:hypothetical protein